MEKSGGLRCAAWVGTECGVLGADCEELFALFAPACVGCEMAVSVLGSTIGMAAGPGVCTVELPCAGCAAAVMGG